MKEIKVSAYCLAYNHEKYIRSALEGFVMQKTNFKFEVFVHDDASTDNTARIIREYAEKYPDIIKPIYQTENQYSQGIKITKAFILPRVSGKYIAICEGDDYWTDENKLQKQFDIMESNDNVSMCVHSVQKVSEDDTEKQGLIPSEDLNYNSNKLFTSEELVDLVISNYAYLFHTSSYFLRKKIIEESANGLSNYINGDESLLRTAISCGDVYYLNDVMSNRRMWAVGNYNNRRLLFSEEKKISDRIKWAKAYEYFNEMTEFEYNDKVVNNIYDRVISLYLDYPRNKDIKLLFKGIKNKYIFNWKYSIKRSIRYIMLNICPCGAHYFFKGFRYIKIKLRGKNAR